MSTMRIISSLLRQLHYNVIRKTELHIACCIMNVFTESFLRIIASFFLQFTIVTKAPFPIMLCMNSTRKSDP